MAVLTCAGFRLLPSPPKGPDILIELDSGERCWIECVVPGPGSTEDKVFQRPPGPFAGSLYPEGALLLRYISVLRAKLAKIVRYMSDGIVRPQDHVLVAVNQGTIVDSDLHDPDIPLMVKAVYPIGEPVFHLVPYAPGGKSRVETPPRYHVTKKNASKVPTTLFLEPAADVISGVLFARYSVRELPWSAEQALYLIHNIRAAAPLKHGSIPLRCEMWPTQTGRLIHKGKCAQYGTLAKHR